MAPGCPGTRSRADGCVDQNQENLDLRHRRPHLEMGRLGAADDSGADALSATSSAAWSRRWAPASPTSSPGELVSGEGPHRLRPLPQLPGRPPPPLPEHPRRRREPSRGVRRIPLDPLPQCLQGRSEHPGGGHFHLRSARQRRAHRAVVGSGGRGRADHRGRSDRLHGRRDLQIRRRPPCRRHRCEPLPARTRRETRCHPHGQRRHGVARRRSNANSA